jgi:hypothetical protein
MKWPKEAEAWTQSEFIVAKEGRHWGLTVCGYQVLLRMVKMFWS